MTEVDRDFTEDRFLGGRLTIKQPKRGFRAGHDSVLIAAAVPAKPGERILELGSGTGVSSLCVATRVQDCRISGIELDPLLVALSNKNAEHNNLEKRVMFVAGDARTASPSDAPFDHVFFNPPFHPDTGQVSPNAARDLAMRDADDAVRSWTENAMRLVRHDGTVSVMLRADRLSDFLEVTGMNGVVVLPLVSAMGAKAKRVIAQLWLGDSRALQTTPEFLMHEDGRPTHGAEAVLRHGAALPLTRA